MKRFLILLFCFLNAIGPALTQDDMPDPDQINDHYILLSDAVESNVRDDYKDKDGDTGTEAKAAEIATFLEGADQDFGTNLSAKFKVFDFDYYLHSSSYINGKEKGLQKAIETIETQYGEDYNYILITKFSTNEKLYKEIEFYLNFDSSIADCYDEASITADIQEYFRMKSSGTINNLKDEIVNTLDYANYKLWSVMYNNCCSDCCTPPDGLRRNNKKSANTNLFSCAAGDPVKISREEQEASYFMSVIRCITNGCINDQNYSIADVPDKFKILAASLPEVPESNKLDLGFNRPITLKNIGPVYFFKGPMSNNIDCRILATPFELSYKTEAFGDTPEQPVPVPGFLTNFGPIQVFTPARTDMPTVLLDNYDKNLSSLKKIIADAKPGVNFNEEEIELFASSLGCESGKLLDDVFIIKLIRSIIYFKEANFSDFVFSYIIPTDGDGAVELLFQLMDLLENPSFLLAQMNIDNNFAIDLIKYIEDEGRRPDFLNKLIVYYYDYVNDYLINEKGEIERSTFIPFDINRYAWVFADGNYTFKSDFNGGIEYIDASCFEFPDPDPFQGDVLPVAINGCAKNPVLNFMDPVILCETSFSEDPLVEFSLIENLDRTVLPAFYLLYVDTELKLNDLKQKLLVVVNTVATVVTGANWVSALRMGRATKISAKLAPRTVQGLQVIRTVDFSATTANLFLSYSSRCQTDAFCKEISKIVFFLELSSMARDIAATSAISAAIRAEKAAAEASKEYSKHLAKNAKNADDLKKIKKVLDEITGLPTSLEARILNASETAVPGIPDALLNNFLTYARSLPELARGPEITEALLKLSNASLVLVTRLDNHARLAEDLIKKYGDNLVQAFNAKPTLVVSWNDMVKGGAMFSTSSAKAVQGFSAITNNATKDLILKLSDTPKNGNNSTTLSDFLNDCFDPEFADLINTPANQNIVKTFVSHKDGVVINVPNEASLEQLLDDIDDLGSVEGDFGDLARKWSYRSGRIQANQSIWAKATKFEMVVIDTDGIPIPGSGVAREAFISSNGLSASNIVEQVSVELNGVKVRLDYIGRKMGIYHFGDAKFSTKEKNWKDEWLSASTTNQTIVYPELILRNMDLKIKVTDPKKRQAIEEAFDITLVKEGNSFVATIKANDIGTFKIIGSEADDFTKVKPPIIDLIEN